MNQLKNLKKISKIKLAKNDPAHDFEHIMRVYRNAEKICKTENGNKKLILSAVLLHDIVKIKNQKDSAIKSAKLSEKILKENNFFDDEIKIISDAIKEHSFSKGKIPSSIEGKILQDADRLDAIGAIGIARAFAYGGSKGSPLYNPDLPPTRHSSKEDYLNSKSHTINLRLLQKMFR